MSDPLAIAIVGVCAALPTSVAAFFSAFFSYKAAIHAQATLAVSRDTQALARHTEENTNHMKDELVALTKKSSHAEGVLEGKAEAKNESTLS